MNSKRLAELERVLQEIEDEEARRKKWAAFERQKLQELRARQRAQEKAELEQSRTVVRKKGGWVLVPKGKNPPGAT